MRWVVTTICWSIFALMAVAANNAWANENRQEPASIKDDQAAPAVDPNQLSFEQNAGIVRAKDGDRTIWQTNLVNPSNKTKKSKTEPVRMGEHLFFCEGGELFQALAADGKISKRQLLPGRCQALSLKEQKVEIRYGSKDGNNPWQQTLLIDAQGPALPFFATANVSTLQARTRARLIPETGDTLEEKDQNLAQAVKEDKAVFEKAVVDLLAMTKRDPSNPWLDYYRAEYLRHLGRAEEAREAYLATLAHGPQSDMELVGMAAGLSRQDPKLGQQAWHRGMSYFLSHGYEPELSTTLITPMIYLGRPERPGMDLEQDSEQFALRTARLRDLAPYSEGIAYYYNALAEEAQRTGDEQAAAAWKKEVAKALPYVVWGPVGGDAPYSGFLLNALTATLFCLFLMLLLKTLRTFPARGVQGVSALRRFNPLGHWTKGELVGFLAGLGFSFWLVIRLANGIATIGMAAGMPFEVAQGNLGHPGAMAYLSDLDQGPELKPGARFIRALSLHQAGRLDSAAALYQKSGYAQAKTNLAAIYHHRGDHKKAKELWMAALAQKSDQHEAAFNLGKESPGLRAARAKKYSLKGPLLAMPSAAMWDDLWQSKLERSGKAGLGNPVSAMFGMAEEGTILNDQGGLFWTVAVCTLMLGGLLALLALLSSFGKAGSEPARGGKVAWGLSLLVPGASRQYSLLGPLFGSLTCFMLLGAYLMHQSDGLSSNFLDAIATPSFSKAYGVATGVIDPCKWRLDSLVSWFWVPLAGHVLFVVLAERLRPDPGGPFARK